MGARMDMAFLGDLLTSVADRGRALIGFERFAGGRSRPVDRLCEDLLSGRGEASGMALAQAVLEAWERLDKPGRRAFFSLLQERFGPDHDRLAKAIDAYREEPSAGRHRRAASRLRAAPAGVAAPAQSRARRHRMCWCACARRCSRRWRPSPNLSAVDTDFRHLFGSWFNRGFLVLRRIDWRTPANVLEKIIRYEAVHEIQGWDDLRRRLEPADRRCFAFFHPQLVDEPLIFVEVALTSEIPARHRRRCCSEERDVAAGAGRDDGGVLFDLELPGGPARHLLRQFPDQAGRRGSEARTAGARHLRHALAGAGLRRAGSRPRSRSGRVRPAPTRSAPSFAGPAGETISLDERRPRGDATSCSARWRRNTSCAPAPRSGRAIDPVARFHLGNGARLERINVGGDLSARGPARVAWRDGELPLRPRRHRDQPRSLRHPQRRSSPPPACASCCGRRTGLIPSAHVEDA